MSSQKTKITQIDALSAALSYQTGAVNTAVVSIEDTQTNVYRFHTTVAITSAPSLKVGEAAPVAIKDENNVALKNLPIGLHEVIKIGADYIAKQTPPLQIYHQRVELVATTDTVSFPGFYDSFTDTFDVYIGGLFQSPNSYTLNVGEKRIVTTTPGSWVSGYVFDIRFTRASKII
jgi:hypothetical protein